MRRWLTACVAALLGMGCARVVPPPGAIRIMPLGDSITEGNWRQNSYRRELWRMLAAAGYSVDFVGSSRMNRSFFPPNPDFDRDHEGHWGWRIDEIRGRIEEWVSTAAPDVVLIHLGTNDINRGEKPEDVAAELCELIDAIRRVAPRAQVLVAGIIPAAGTEAQIARMNDVVRGLLRVRGPAGPRVRVVDQFTGFEVAADTYDGVHPNDAGDRKLAERWFDALVDVLPAPAARDPGS